ncbi:MAG: LD-carboxypeptidase [Deltaproteobacteria bacterium]|nr:MAG: LD-carboxypeptidase [Deltaproteobacteria bacterium]
MPGVRKPRALSPGGTIGIAAPAGPIDADRIAAGERLLRDAGFRVARRPDLTERCGYLAGDDARRAAELLELWADPGVDAILCARGGYGCHRIMSRLDARCARDAAKPLIGYSDITTLLLWQRRRCGGLVGFHGPMLEREPLDAESADALFALLAGATPAPLRGAPGGGGRAEGVLAGGSLRLVVASLGTPWEIDTRGAILLVEDVNEKPYSIDRMLQQLRAAGKLEGLAGFGAGAFVDCEDPRYPEPSVDAVIEEVVRPLGIPFVRELPFGHVSRNLPWPLGIRAACDGERGEIELLEPGVELR